MAIAKESSVAPVADAAPKRAHIATFATDNKKGGYLIRVIGPHAEKFAGREVPVTRRDGTESAEKLVKILWTGVDEDKPATATQKAYKGTGLPAALYTFAPKPPVDDVIDF